LELPAAYRHCRQLAFGHYENFPVASLLLPQPQRDAIAAIYAFARTADDYADEAEYAPKRVALLRGWMAKLDQDPGEDPIFLALDDARRRYRLPKHLLQDLVKAFLQDCRKRRYADAQQLRAYCRRSADPVGRLVLRVFDLDDERNVADSDAICTALQLTNHWQDLGKDVSHRDRIYLPQDAMRRHGVTEAQLKGGHFDAKLAALMKEQVDLAESLFAQGQGLPARLPGRLGLEIRLTLLGGRAILARLRRNGYDSLTRRPHLSKKAMGWLLVKGLLGKTA